MTATGTSTIINLFAAQTTDTTTNAVVMPFNTGVVTIWGTWNGATVKLQTAVPGSTSTFVDVMDMNGNTALFNAGGTNTDVQVTITDMIYDKLIRAVIANSGASTNLNATIERLA